tara:strand:+ start:638 stop:1162 length:525 start_codon:yes stop_codon:yes gene_type:complete
LKYGQSNKSWQESLFFQLKKEGVKQISFVPDAGHSKLIDLAVSDPLITTIALTTEEEGVALSCGAWLGGNKTVLLMQSSGVGNCVNMFSILKSCDFPFLTIITMRGEFAEFNSWQKPMGSATQEILQAMDFEILRVEQSEQVTPFTKNALKKVFLHNSKVAILLSQKFIGQKKW